MDEPRIFSGPASEALWDDINRLDALSTGDEVRDVIYHLCCKIQELEYRLSRKGGSDGQDR